MTNARLKRHLLALLLLPFFLTACIEGVNGPVVVEAGASVSDASTVNGSVHLEEGARANEASTVNGSIRLDEGARAGEVETVNGSVTLAQNAIAGSIETVNGEVTLGEGAAVSGDVAAVNGALHLAKGSVVNGALSNVNGDMELVSAKVGQGISTVDGDIAIRGDSVIDGGILVEKPDDGGIDLFGSDAVPRIVIGPGATVNGPLTFERPVELYISDRAEVSGTITGAQAIAFSGSTPPAS